MPFTGGRRRSWPHDLSHTANSGLKLQICGDCHLLNFGGFATAERQLIFDINDFDETATAPWEWDVKRLTTSFVIAGQASKFSAKDCREAARLAAKSYRLYIAEYAKMPVLQAWYDALDLDEIINSIQDKQNKRFYTRKLEKAAGQSAHEKEFAKLAFTSGRQTADHRSPPAHLPLR